MGFQSHRTLAQTAGDLLPKFTVSTKVGYLPGPHGAEHSLNPVRLLAAVEQAVRDFGREPELVFLHNPEQSLREAGARGREALAAACEALREATVKGLCGAWGVASWAPSPLPGLIDKTVPRPAVLMVRAGLLVGAGTLDATDALTAAWGLGSGEVWGMSPFAGSASSPVWERFDPRVFLRGDSGFSRVQAAFRIAYALPRVAAVAVGTDQPSHLAELVDALNAGVNTSVTDEYRCLLRERFRGQPD
ncbi:hypothetical protein ADK64_34015 [Streptomyces sp. MMG1121]|nr:hypothetical protein ADK64_34015 [Streptomyces sp. MMG1121]